MNAMTPPDDGVFDIANARLTDEDLDHSAAAAKTAYGVTVADALDSTTPDDAAEAKGISDLTGAPPLHVADNLEEYRDDIKKQTAKALVLDNPELISYIQSHPLAAGISGDDWANLDKFTRESAGGFMQWLQKPHALGQDIGERELEGIVGAIQSDDMPDEVRRAMDPHQNVLGALGAGAATLVYGGSDVVYKALQGLMAATTGAAEGVGDIVSPRLGRELGAMTEFEMTRGDAPHGEHLETTGPFMERAAKPAPPTAPEAARPWIAAGEEPPIGVHPEIDAAKAEANKTVLEKLGEDLQNATASTTRERSPEMFEQIAKRLYGDAKIGVDGDLVAQFYGDKPPTVDDGFLGWAPNIESQVVAARETGSRVEIPLSDWFTKVDPKLRQTLQDYISVKRDWPSAAEAKELPTEAKAVVDQELPAVRAAAGLEPKFSVGDRKLQLDLQGKELNEDIGAEEHDYDMLDENQKPVGRMRLTPGPDGKTLYVNYIGGQAGLWSNSFGPALVRDLKSQLKALYPDYEYLTGHRVTGARVGLAAAGEGETPMPLPRVRLSAPKGWDVVGGLSDNLNDHMRALDIFQNGWERFSNTMEVNRQEPGFFTHEQMAIGQATYDEVKKLTGGLESEGVAGIRGTGRGMTHANDVRGMYAPAYDAPPDIVYDLLGPDPKGVGRHESIHFLKDYKLFTPDEWSTLEAAAHSEGWLERYGIHERYANASEELKTEEAIAEGFREWAAQDEATRPKTGIGAIFQKLWDFLDRIRQGMEKYLGREPTWEEVFKRTASGEVGAREPGVPGQEGQFRFSVEEQREAITEGLTNLQAASVGMDAQSFKRIQAAIRKQAEEDLRKRTATLERQANLRTTTEWKSNRADMADQVSKEIRDRPDVMADQFLAQPRVRLDRDKLTPEQRAALPEHYTGEGGIDPDLAASAFGYNSGDEMVNRVAALNALKVDAEGKPMRNQDFLRKLVSAETDRRMELRYGHTAEEALSDARDQALSESSLNVMHEELMAAAQRGGVTAFDKQTMQKAARDLINEFPIGKVSSYRLMQDMGRHARNAEKAMAGGDWAGAAVHMQRQTLSAMVAAEAKAVEKEVGKFDKVAKRMAKREIESLPAEYTNWVHDILMRSGKPVKRGPEDLRREISAQDSGQTLQAFVEHKNSWLQPVAVWDQLYDPKWQSEYQALKVPEFRAVAGSVNSLVKVGRDELKIYKQGEAEDFATVKENLLAALKEFEARPEPAGGEGPIGGNLITDKLRTYLASSLQIENIFGRWDRYEPYGDWTQYVLRGLVDGVNQSDAWKKEFAGKLGALKDNVDLRKNIENNLFHAPNDYGGHTLTMNRANLRAVMLNVGNASNLDKLAKGWGLSPEAIMGWVKSKADAKDWKFAQGVWDIFDEMKGRSDTMYRSLSGVPAEDIVRTPIETAHGTFPGGYYPVIYHENYAKVPKLQEVGLTQDGFEGATTPAGYTKSRTQFQAPLSMSLDRMPNRLSQVIHDTALRPAVLQAAKVFRDKQIQAAMTTHYGREYTEMMIPWLRNVANAATSVQRDSPIVEGLRQNLISALVGFNPGTVLKHAPTAAVLSVKEVGADKFFGAVRTMFSQNDAVADSNWGFAIKNSLELQRRDRNWNETLYGATGELVPRSNTGVWRQKIMQWGSKPVAMSDMISAVPTWLARYTSAIEEGKPHGDAVFEADRAVRRAHGSTAVTNRPMITSQVSPWLTSVYNFFNDVMNRQVETLWKAGEMVGAAKDGRYDAAMKLAGPVITGAFAYAIWPAIVEAWVSPQESKPDDSWAKRAGKGMAYTLGASWVGVRDVANFLIEGGDPTVGLIGTEMRSLFNATQDLKKEQPYSPAHAQKLIRDAGSMVGALTGIPNQISREASFAQGLASGAEHPQGPWGWLVGARYGTIKGHSRTGQEYLSGQYDRRR